MRASATEDERAFYGQNGFVVIEEFLDSGELAQWRQAFDVAVAERGQVAVPGLAAPRKTPAVSYYEKVFTQRVNLWQTNERMKELMLDERIGKLATDLAGLDGVRLYHDQALIKEPWGNPTAFHLDVPYWAFDSVDALSIWIALDDATLQNGALMYIPGSHRAERFDNVGIGSGLGDLFSAYPEWADVMPVACPVKAGTCVFHNGLTAHGAGANMTPGRRRAMTAGFMPEGSTFNGKPSIYRPEQLAKLCVGDVLDDEEQTPLVWTRRKVLR